ncbi:MAG: septal ring lytic transglycosylase RlpA family protein [Treponemataceae bacterium]
MKRFLGIFTFLFFAVSLSAQANVISAETYASFYGDEFHGRQTANGEIYDMNAFTAAHRTLPFGSVVEVVNLDTGATVFVRINDRGPFVANREIDLSKVAANAIGMIQHGIARVSIKLVSTPTEVEKPASTQQAQPNTKVITTTTQVTTQTQTAPTNAGSVYTPAQKAQGLVLWRIQLGSFTREENALRLVESLRKVGFEPAYEKTDNMVRVVLYGIRQTDLDKVQNVLKINDFNDYVIRQESW